MGVPGFFAWLLHKYNNILSENINDEVDIFYIDANCLFHPICLELVKEDKISNNSKLEKKMISNIIEYIDYLIDFVKPKHIFLAVDGVAPMAKINQQKKRRYKTMLETEMKNKIKMKYGIISTQKWSNVAITPGTIFMKKLDKSLEEKYGNNDDVTYSSYKKCGEGEHKILEHIKKQNNKNCVIYGLDADLIFLSLTNPHNTIYLLREKNQINTSELNNNLTYVSMDIARKSYVEQISKVIKNIQNFDIEIDEKNIINDFIFICYLLGNDFVPNLEEINIKNNGVDILIKTYANIFLNKKKYLLDVSENRVKINNGFLVDFIKYLSHVPQKPYKQYQKTYIGTDPIEKEIFELDNLITFDNEYMIKYNIRTCDDYYKIYFNTDINTIISEYLTGLVWVSNYYFIGCPSWNWYYPYTKAPLLRDMINYFNITMINLNNIRFDYGNPLKPSEQLLLVIPPKYKYIIPEKYRQKMADNNTIIKIDVTGKDMLWKCDIVM